MTQIKIAGVLVPTAGHISGLRNDPAWNIFSEQAGTHNPLDMESFFKALSISTYVRFYQAPSGLTDIEVMKPDLEAYEIADEMSPALDDPNFASKADFKDAYESLRGQYEANKTQLVEEQKTTAMYVRQRDDILDRYNEESRKCRQMESLLQDKNSGQLLMFECYSGIVEASSEDSATIVFETDDDVVEHLYEREQFTDGKIPEEGQRVSVCFYLSELQEVEVAELPKDWDTEDDFIDFRSRRKNVVKGPYTI